MKKKKKYTIYALPNQIGTTIDFDNKTQKKLYPMSEPTGRKLSKGEIYELRDSLNKLEFTCNQRYLKVYRTDRLARLRAVIFN